jgi:hypothetical protein
MIQVTLSIPDDLYERLEMSAVKQGLLVDEYLIQTLAQAKDAAYTVRAVPPEEIAKQRQEYATLLQSLRTGTFEEVQAALDAREPAEPEEGLTPEVLQRLQERFEVAWERKRLEYAKRSEQAKEAPSSRIHQMGD